jgi:cytochrome c oxidase assembly protein subunit 15
MGCPDWPHCFGKWVPPTDVSQLPVDYKERFKVAHHVIADFNVIKTWTEYINRLLGVIVGIFVSATFIASLKYFKEKRSLVVLSFGIMLLTGLQGWFGAKLVASNLAEHMITIHMLIALLIVSLALLLYQLAIEKKEDLDKEGNNWMLYITCFTLLHILLGTQIRQEIDTIAIRHQDMHREMWVGELSEKFALHRVGAIISVALNLIYSVFFIRKNGVGHLVSKLLFAVNIIFALEYLAGVGMVRWDIPYFIQPVHLVLASLAFGLQFCVWLLTRAQKQQKFTVLSTLSQ